MKNPFSQPKFFPQSILSSLFAALLTTALSFSAWAAPQVPFAASFSTAFESVLAFPLVLVQVAGSGEARHFGTTTAESTDQIVDLLAGTVTATYVLTAANGDQLVCAFLLDANFVPGGLEISGDWSVLGGTGRFDGATGGGTLEGVGIFTGPSTGIDHFTMVGTISSPGSLK